MSTKRDYIIQAQVEGAHSPFGQVELPCGFLRQDELLTTCLVREIGGDEQDLLSSQRIKPLDKINAVLQSVVVSMGTYRDQAFLEQAVIDLPLGDRLVLLLAARRFTSGDIYPYEDKCPNPRCEQKALYELNLTTLDLRLMAEPRKRVYEVVLPKSGTARWHPMTGRDELTVAKYEGSKISQQILGRLDLLNGKPPTLKEIKALPGQDIDTLLAEFDTWEGGIDTSVQMKCPECKQEFERELDIAQEGFFFPTRARKRWSRKSSP